MSLQAILKEFPKLEIDVLLNLSVGDLADEYPEVFKKYGAISFLADRKLSPLIVLESRAGFFIGTFEFDGPQRESLQYFPTEEQAKTALQTGNWIQYNPDYY